MKAWRRVVSASFFFSKSILELTIKGLKTLTVSPYHVYSRSCFVFGTSGIFKTCWWLKTKWRHWADFCTASDSPTSFIASFSLSSLLLHSWRSQKCSLQTITAILLFFISRLLSRTQKTPSCGRVLDQVWHGCCPFLSTPSSKSDDPPFVALWASSSESTSPPAQHLSRFPSLLPGPEGGRVPLSQ